MKKRSFVPVVVACVLALSAVACSSSSKSGSDSGATQKLVALDNVFNGGKPLQVNVGDTVNFVNNGHNDHDIVSDPQGQFGIDAAGFMPGSSYQHTFSKPGTYHFYCSLHGDAKAGMTGVVQVGAAAATSTDSGSSSADKSGLNAAANTVGKASGHTIHVPADQATIQKAVDAAKPGDLILIAEGTYHEGVDVPSGKDNLTIRGVDRNKVILDGDYKKANGIAVVKANGVTVENMTAQRFTKNGFYWTGVIGYRGSYLNAYRNGDYGIYSFQSTRGEFDHDYGSGSPDAGFYIGGCQPCNAQIIDSVAEWNGLGYSGTNSGGGLTIARSTFRFNRAGIVPNSGSYEANAPQRGNLIVGNLVYDNNNGKSPAIDISITAMGNGILIAGGSDNLIERNLVWKHGVSGVTVITYPEDGDHIWTSSNNVVRQNNVSESGLADIGLWYSADGKGTGGNCFSDNVYTKSAPTNLEQVAPCPGTTTGDAGTNGAFDLGKLATNDGKPPSVDYKIAETPPLLPQENMPNAATAPGQPATNVPYFFDVESIPLPARPAGS